MIYYSPEHKKENDPMSKIIKHDKLFRKALENPIVAQEFFAAHLPSHIKSIIDPSSLRMEKESFVEQSLRGSISDVLFSVKFSNEQGYLYLLAEHQSSSDSFMAFRLFRYMINIVARHREQHPEAKYLPLVYPLVFYNGEQKYTAPLNIWDLFENSKLAKEIWTNDYRLINVHEIPDEEFKKRAWSGIMEFFLKNINHRNLLQKLDDIAEVFPEIAKLTIGFDYLELMLTYSLTTIDKDDKIKLEEMLRAHLNKESGEKLMTSLAHHWEQEGIEKGILEGIQQGIEKGIQVGEARGIQVGEARGIQVGEARGIEKAAINMLKQGLEPKLVSQCTGIPIAKIQMLKY